MIRDPCQPTPLPSFSLSLAFTSAPQIRTHYTDPPTPTPPLPHPVIVLAFPTSATIAVVKRQLPLLTLVVLLSSIISFFSMAALSRLLIQSIAIGTGSTGSDIPFALATLTHSVSTPVAIGYHNVLCVNGHAATASTTGPAHPQCAS